MEILHLTDLHFHRPWLEWIAERARTFDAVAISGDLLDLEHEVPPQRQIEWLRQWALRFPVPLVLSPGCIDLDYFLELRCLWMEELASEQVIVGGGCLKLGEWMIESLPWDGLPARWGERHIVVAHRGPPGTPSMRWLGAAFDDGNPLFANRLRSLRPPPAFVLHGRVHAPLLWCGLVGRTRCANPGTADPDSPEPNHLILDLDTLTLEWRPEGVPTATLRRS